jgi:enolase-phosphatase E1
MKRNPDTYTEIASIINIKPNRILFLSDIVQELQAAEKAGFQTIQLVRIGTQPRWKNVVESFTEITSFSKS